MLSSILSALRNMWVIVLVIFFVLALVISMFVSSALSSRGEESAAPETTSAEETQADDQGDPVDQEPEGPPSQEPSGEGKGPDDQETQAEGGKGSPDSSPIGTPGDGIATYSSGFPQTITSVDVYDTIQSLEIAPESEAEGYDRDMFPHWSTSADNPACNMRWMTLYEQSPNREWYDEANCILAEPVYWVDPYGAEDPDTGEVTHLESADPEDFDIDHVVALEAVWASGGASLSEAQREAIANDPINLVVSDKSVNRSKGSQRADTWLPPDPEFRCEYVQRYATVKSEYGLTVTQAEHDRLSEEWEACS